MKINFNDDKTKTGIEGWYEVKNDTLVFFIKATSNLEDWISDLTAFPVPVMLGSGLGFCHAGYKAYAYWMAAYIMAIKENNPGIKNVVVTGYSMGGGIAQIVGVIIQNWITLGKVKVISIDGPRTTTKLPASILVIRNKGSLIADIPFWFKRAKSIVLNKKRRPFWIAHADYDIEKIISEETK